MREFIVQQRIELAESHLSPTDTLLRYMNVITETDKAFTHCSFIREKNHFIV